jgi:hypothetical protein
MLSVSFTSTLLTSPDGTNVPASGLGTSYEELPAGAEYDDTDIYMDAMDSLDEQQ